MCRYWQVEWLYENGYDSDGCPSEVKEGVPMMDDVKRQHEIINLVSRESRIREGRCRLQADPCATFCTCGLELLRSKDVHECLHLDELHELYVEGYSGNTEEGRDRDQLIVCGVELQ
jgi:hypothetical protein